MPDIAAPRLSEFATLFPSPMKATVTPFSPPFFSRTVSRSASAWHGCSPSESALMTGTDAHRAISTIVSVRKVRAAMQST